eukprot:CAMPEP_0119015796 /NCGR_PEP_ID=MMETSP1176-20130426/11642_1 /TAXON_ID=265551 /ORGANISM="Synedropsis recta cf, Strain CCMP1620" /LENGTH=187 /DNA_ID=CAMNT_0006969117 /DNA_START=103 /DNA_END=667 /DNA_ORIENTATION=-
MVLPYANSGILLNGNLALQQSIPEASDTPPLPLQASARYFILLALTPKSESPIRDDDRTCTIPLPSTSRFRSSTKGFPPLKLLAKNPFPEDRYSIVAVPAESRSSLAMLQPPPSTSACPSCGYDSITERRSLMAFDLAEPAGGIHLANTQLFAFGEQASKALEIVGEPTTTPAAKVWNAWRRFTGAE